MLRQRHEDFLRLLWDGPGEVCVAKALRDTQVYGVEDAIKLATDIASSKKGNSYICPSLFSSGTRRAKANVTAVKAFWVDCDFKDYEGGKDQAIASVRRLTDSFPPTAVWVTGGGVHIYWVLDKATDIDSWSQVARAFKAYIVANDVTRDKKTLANQATLMRLPGSYSAKREAVVDGRFTPQNIYTLQQIIARVGTTEPTASEKKSDVPSIYSLLSPDGWPEGFQLLPPEHATGFPSSGNTWDPVYPDAVIANCAMTQYFIESLGVVPEPMWFAFAGLAVYLHGGEKWYHQVSSGDKRYNQGQCQSKLDNNRSERGSPTPCTEFDDCWTGEADKSPCLSCPYQSQLRSPWDLADRVQPTSAATSAADVPNASVEPASPILLPKGYVADRATGLISRRKATEDGAGNTTYEYVPVCKYPLEILGRVYDKATDERLLILRIHLGADGIRELRLPIEEVTNPGALAKTLAKQGVLIGVLPVQINSFAQFILDTYNHLQVANKEVTHLARFGWHAGNSFLCGPRLYRPGAITDHFSASRYLLEKMEQRSAEYTVSGSVSEWVAMAERAVGHRQMRYHRAILAMGFATPLVALTSYDSAVIALRGASGVGKSALLRLVASIYGTPKAKHLIQMDTDFAAMERIADMGALPVTFDETTGMDGTTLSKMIFQAAQGRTKEAGTYTGATRAVRTWRTYLFTGSNDGIYNVLREDHDGVASGEMYRTLEISMPKLSDIGVPDDPGIEDELKLGPHGAVGDVWLRYIVDHREEVAKMVQRCGAAVAKRNGHKSPERFWNNLIGGTAVASAVLAKQLGLYPFNPEEIIETVLQINQEARMLIAGGADSSMSAFEAFLAAQAENTVIVPGFKVSVDPPRRTANVRIFCSEEGITKPDRVAIRPAALRAWLSRRRIPMTQFMEDLQETGSLLDQRASIRLLADTGVASMSSKCLLLDKQKLEEAANDSVGD